MEKRSALSLEGFLREYFVSGSPVIITDCMAHWPARTRWNDLDYLRRVAGDRTVPVEVINLPVIVMNFSRDQRCHRCLFLLCFLQNNILYHRC